MPFNNKDIATTTYAQRSFFNFDKKVAKYNYKRKKPLRRPFRVDKLNMFLKRWRIGWSRDIMLPQMSPTFEFTGVEDKEETMDVSWVPKEQQYVETADEVVYGESSDGSSWERLHEDDTTSLEEDDDDGEDSHRYDLDTLDTLQQIFEDLDCIDPGTDEDLLEDVEAMLHEISEMNRLMRPQSRSQTVTPQEQAPRDEPGVNWESIRSDYYRDTQAEEYWSFDEENDCLGHGLSG
ncbi:hypothetical protein AA313_de0200667 [Arthrobotrys entomopaga]|nr:hypothetical protein AA313_de0200667 [Arthrobotrys entomopaga]